MTKPIPPISKYMTTTPLSIEKDANLLDAANMMQKNQIRHLPVVYQNKIEGILSSTDINLIRGLKNFDIEKLKVYDCFTPNPYIVSPETLLDVVLDEMAEKKYGSVLIEDKGLLVGIFTWIDALKASKSLLETRLKK
jgi:acetoin utilization protein AcuB